MRHGVEPPGRAGMPSGTAKPRTPPMGPTRIWLRGQPSDWTDCRGSQPLPADGRMDHSIRHVFFRRSDRLVVYARGGLRNSVTQTSFPLTFISVDSSHIHERRRGNPRGEDGWGTGGKCSFTAVENGLGC